MTRWYEWVLPARPKRRVISKVASCEIGSFGSRGFTFFSDSWHGVLRYKTKAGLDLCTVSQHNNYKHSYSPDPLSLSWLDNTANKMASISSSSSSPPSYSPLLHGRHDRNSSFSDSSPRQIIDFRHDSTDSTKHSRLPGSLLMRDSERNDPAYDQKQRAARRRMKAFVFDDIHLDWKAAPAMEDSQHYDWRALATQPNLRIASSRQYLYQVRDDLRRIQYSPPAINISDTGTLILDGEEAFDMIG